MVKGIPRFGNRPSDLDKLLDTALAAPQKVVVTGEGVVQLPPTEIQEAPSVAAEPEVEIQVRDENMPWKAGHPLIIKYFQIRMPEPLKLKIEWLAARRVGTKKGSEHEVALKALEREIDRIIAKIQKTEK